VRVRRGEYRRVKEKRGKVRMSPYIHVLACIGLESDEHNIL
jgi:hypothetical protein